eukprot:6652972-Prymnesium_polylepis.1
MQPQQPVLEQHLRLAQHLERRRMQSHNDAGVCACVNGLRGRGTRTWHACVCRCVTGLQGRARGRGTRRRRAKADTAGPRASVVRVRALMLVCECEPLSRVSPRSEQNVEEVEC